MNPSQLLENPDAHPLLLHEILSAEFGPTYAGWGPETLWLEISRDIGPLISRNKHRIQAVRSVLVSTTVTVDIVAFQAVMWGLLGMPPMFDQIVPPNVEDLAGGVKIINHLYKSSLKFGIDICGYCAAVLADSGFVLAPPFLDFANAKLAAINPPQDVAAVKSALADIATLERGSRTEIQLSKIHAVVTHLKGMDALLEAQAKG